MNKPPETNPAKSWLILVALRSALLAIRLGLVLFRPFAPPSKAARASQHKSERSEVKEARLAGIRGRGLLVHGRGDADAEGATVGLWHAETPRAYETLYALYQSQDRILYHGYVYDETTRQNSLQTPQVVISSWARQDHPDCLELCAHPPRQGTSRRSSVTLPQERER